MQRNQFKVEVGVPPRHVKVENIQRPWEEFACNGGLIHTFSDVRELRHYQATSHKVIHVSNPKIDEMKNLI